MTVPPVPDAIHRALSRHPEIVQERLLEIRHMIFTVAADIGDVGPLMETLKWGEPAYLTEVSRSGTTIRLGATREVPHDSALLFNCKTSLIDMFRTAFPDEFKFDGNRALVIPADRAMPCKPLLFCLSAALTYHRRKGTGSRSQRSKKTEEA
ncbi:DUF1801 domain-containing protein [Rhizobium sp. WL3]|uniref:DUF1801 domain-containing protein n=1 Tax=Rhizobium sp. WL3 TaxID=2603277 RepID=UPI00164F64FF|nr:DUF1801 domain-containing protein [Rhizobium sp. WL3]